jgi:hypothetical protein
MEFHYFSGRVWNLTGEYDKAIEAFSQALVSRPLMNHRREQLTDEALCFAARSAHRRYSAVPSRNNLVAASEAWNKVKDHYARRTDDRHFNEAVSALATLEPR